MSFNSKRKYRVLTAVGTANEPLVEDFEISLNEIVDSNRETCYSLQEIIDEVMDIPETCSMYFNPVRGNLGAKGIIVRVK